MTGTLIAAMITGAACISCFIWAGCLRYCRKINRVEASQQEDVFNISSRVEGQNPWPTHNQHVSMDYTIANEINKYNDDPPTYEEAMQNATLANNNVAVLAVVPKTTVTPTSTSASATN